MQGVKVKGKMANMLKKKFADSLSCSPVFSLKNNLIVKFEKKLIENNFVF